MTLKKLRDDLKLFVVLKVSYHNCWALDNIIVVNTANNPTQMYEDFDPVDPGNWIFFPGAHVEVSKIYKN